MTIMVWGLCCLKALKLTSYWYFFFQAPFLYILQCRAQLTLDTFILAGLPGYLAILMLAIWISLHYNIYKDFVKLATFKISYLK